MAADPPYRKRHAGPVLIVGSAPRAMNDVAAALRLEPSAAVMTVNEGALLIKADFLTSQHPEILPGLRHRHEQAFGTGATVHLAAGDRDEPRIPGVDFIWRRTSSAATSAWGAVRIAKAMGFAPVILCGCPINGGDGYAMPTFGGEEGNRLAEANPRLGFQNPASPLILGYQRALWLASQEEGMDVYSMSGYSRLILGAPKGA